MCTVSIDIVDIDTGVVTATNLNCGITNVFDHGNHYDVTFVGTFADLFFLRKQLMVPTGIISKSAHEKELDDLFPIRVLQYEVETM